MLTFSFYSSTNVLEPHFNGLNYWTTYYNDQREIERERNIVETLYSDIS